MAIIKNGRINIWNAVKKQFETVHPETETARITDFADGIVQKLALTSAMTAVTALQTDSWFGKLLKMALTASGVKYSIAENGYVCFGELFGSLIIQWGSYESVSYYTDITFPITFPDKAYAVYFTDSVSAKSSKRDDIYACVWNVGATTASNARMLCSVSTGAGSFAMIAIGK